MKKLYLVSNAHIDPVWQWEKEEGIGATITTFASAAKILEENEHFIFNHNESLLYSWIEEYAPSLFERIKKLVKKGQWQITGGWYIQPDVNMPSGESIVRQILKGYHYFKDKFSVTTNVTVNYDSFGHSDGLVQILNDANYIGYVCVRPQRYTDNRDFVWKGFNGSKIKLHTAHDGYNSLLGNIQKKLPYYFEQLKNVDRELLLWGVGNHGGGPSREDLKYLDEIIKERKDIEIFHSTNEKYFAEMPDDLPSLPAPLNYFMQGCYTSQIRIKQKHFLLENELVLTERMLGHAELSKMTYDESLLKRAEEDLLFSEFHDILPGTSIKEAEDAALVAMDRGLENLKQLKTKAFFKLCEGQDCAKKGEFPIMVYNPHPYSINETMTVEFMLADQNWDEQSISVPEIYFEGKKIESQLEKESSNIPLDWRKRVVFNADLEPFKMHRFNCFLKLKEKENVVVENNFKFKTESMSVEIDDKTGLISSYKVLNQEFVSNAMQIEVINGSSDPWGFYYDSYKESLGKFRLANEIEVEKITNLKSVLPINIIETGDVRTVVEAFFVYNNSYAIINYIIPKKGKEIKIILKLMNLEKDKYLKLCIPTILENIEFIGKTCYGESNFLVDGTEVVSSGYRLLKNDKFALSLLDFGNYGSSFKDGELKISLINSACYTAHPIDNRKLIKDDRYSDRIDIGERNFEFYLNAGDVLERTNNIAYENAVKSQKVMALNFFPIGDGEKPVAYIKLSNKKINLSAVKNAEKSDDKIIRLFNSQNNNEIVEIEIQKFNLKQTINFKGYEFKTFKIKEGKLIELNILEIEK